MATSNIYSWQDSVVGGTLLHLPQPNSFNSATSHWGFPAASTYTSGIYQTHQTINPTAVSYTPSLAADASNHDVFMTLTAHPAHAITPVSSTNLFTSGDGTPFIITGLGDNPAMQSVPSPAANLNDMANGSSPNSVLKSTTNSTLADAGGSHKEEGKIRLKKCKSHNKEDTQLILPDGVCRPHKPHKINQNYVPSAQVPCTPGQKGRGSKQGRCK